MIDINEIQKIENHRRQIKKQIYTVIYEQFSRKIRQSVDYGQKQVFLRVPSFVMGYPAFDRVAAARYLQKQLNRGGFTTQLIGEIDIYVSWETSTRKNSQKNEQHEEVEFPSFVNLRKAANKYRK
jgi:hypothetical protein